MHRWFSRLATLVFAVMIGVALVAQDAEAGRLGGGKSFGRQSPNATRQASPPSATGQRPSSRASPRPFAAADAVAGQSLARPIAGLAAGLGIAALLSHFGMGGAFADGLGNVLVIVLLVGAAVFIWRMLRGSAAERPAAVGWSPPMARRRERGTGAVSAYTPVAGSTHARLGGGAQRVWGKSVPADFDVGGFLRNAKVYFIRLQAAWDAKNLDDIREFATPEVFAEIKMQIDEEKGTQNKTEIITQEAELLGIDTTAVDYLASVRFTGTIGRTLVRSSRSSKCGTSPNRRTAAPAGCWPEFSRFSSAGARAPSISTSRRSRVPRRGSASR
jgi:predicted lipid-binding transport protein (Tim44 family)